jgi:hypothetical protein
MMDRLLEEIAQSKAEVSAMQTFAELEDALRGAIGKEARS